MKYSKRSGLFANSSKTLTYDPLAEVARSYGWYILAQRINGVLVLNNCNYSSSTVRHIHKMRKHFDSMLNMPYVEFSAPKGLQDLGGAIAHYQGLIRELQDAMLKKGSKASANVKRQEQVRECETILATIRSLMAQTEAA